MGLLARASMGGERSHNHFKFAANSNKQMPANSLKVVSTASSTREPEENVYDDGHLRVEHDNYYITCGGRALNLPRAEFLFVSRLARNPERIVSAEDLWQHAWGTSKPLNAQSLHVYIYRLRHKLEPYGLKIDTMIGVGYRLLPAIQAKL